MHVQCDSDSPRDSPVTVGAEATSLHCPGSARPVALARRARRGSRRCRVWAGGAGTTRARGILRLPPSQSVKYSGTSRLELGSVAVGRRPGSANKINPEPAGWPQRAAGAAWREGCTGIARTVGYSGRHQALGQSVGRSGYSGASPAGRARASGVVSGTSQTMTGFQISTGRAGLHLSIVT